MCHAFACFASSIGTLSLKVSFKDCMATDNASYIAIQLITILTVHCCNRYTVLSMKMCTCYYCMVLCHLEYDKLHQATPYDPERSELVTGLSGASAGAKHRSACSRKLSSQSPAGTGGEAKW